MSYAEMSYEELEKKKSALDKQIELIYNIAHVEAQEMYGDIEEWANQHQINGMMREFIDKELLDSLESKYNKINEAMAVIEQECGIKTESR